MTELDVKALEERAEFQRAFLERARETMKEILQAEDLAEAQTHAMEWLRQWRHLST